MLTEAFPTLIIGFSLGLMHALDADHVMAVSVLSAQKCGFKRTLLHCANWALGHSGVLMVTGVLLFGLGVALPESIQHLAEMGVGLLLVVLGGLFIMQIRKNKLQLVTHRHGDVAHTHWQDGNDAHDKSDLHKPVFVGILHGLAGSAPALALIPAVASGQLYYAIFYLLLFSVGVMLSMLVFGLSFAHLQKFLNQRYQQAFQISRYLLALASIGLGGFWFFSAL
ncbi:MAG: sulfite exporter TauE/SafE family protein [Reinekea sp.]|jgi:nickel/cobalt transporter (NicO) family protein